MDYTKLYEDEVHDVVRERRTANTSIETARNEFAEYLKNNFHPQLEEIQRHEVEKREEKSPECEKHGFKKFIDKLIKTL